MINWRECLASDPNICGGQLCAKGTRVFVTVILDSLAEGAGRDEILRSRFSSPLNFIQLGAAEGSLHRPVRPHPAELASDLAEAGREAETVAREGMAGIAAWGVRRHRAVPAGLDGPRRSTPLRERPSCQSARTGTQGPLARGDRSRDKIAIRRAFLCPCAARPLPPGRGGYARLRQAYGTGVTNHVGRNTFGRQARGPRSGDGKRHLRRRSAQSKISGRRALPHSSVCISPPEGAFHD